MITSGALARLGKPDIIKTETGPHGSGKTTRLEAIAAPLRAKGYTVSIDGDDDSYPPRETLRAWAPKDQRQS